MRLRISPIDSTSPLRRSASDVTSFAVLTACVGARVALDVADGVIASLLAWSGAVDAIGGVLASDSLDSLDDGGAAW